MKTHLLLLLFLLITLTKPATAQVPQKFSFQGVARDDKGKVVSSQTVNLRLSIRQETVLGQAVYVETHSAQTSPAGVFNISVGGGATESGQFDQIDWVGASYVLQVEMTMDGSTNYVNLGATQLLSVPYAVQAAKAEVAKEAEHAAVAGEADRWKNDVPIIQEGGVLTGPLLPDIDFTLVKNRFLWYPRKGAIRFGAWVEAKAWTEANLGFHSFAAGTNAMASENHSFSFGLGANASAESSVAFGEHNEAQSRYAFALGSNSIASGYKSMALGINLKAEGVSSVAVGEQNQSLANGAITIGKSLQSRALNGVVIGERNDISDALTNDYQENRRIFQIGNGIQESNTRSNALTILRNGNVGLGNNVLAPTHILDVGHRMRLRANPGFSAGLFLDNSSNVPYAFFGGYDNNNIGFYFENAGWRFIVNHQGNAELSGTLKQNSDIRLKKDITPLTVNFDKLGAISGRHYYWKDNTRSQSLQTGLIAQEVEAVFPELVETNQDGFKSVNYIGLIPHLLEAVKELKEENNRLIADNHKYASNAAGFENLKKRLEAIEASLAKSSTISVK